MTKLRIWVKSQVTNWRILPHKVIASKPSSSTHVRVKRLQYPLIKLDIMPRVIFIRMDSKMVLHLRNDCYVGIRVDKVKIFGEVIGNSIIKDVELIKHHFFHFYCHIGKICSIKRIILESTKRVVGCIVIKRMGFIKLVNSSRSKIWGRVHVFCCTSNMVFLFIRLSQIIRIYFFHDTQGHMSVYILEISSVIASHVYWVLLCSCCWILS